MKIFLQFVMLMAIGGLAILLAIVLGDRGAWYLAWLLGTVVIVLVAAAAGLMLDTQDDELEIKGRAVPADRRNSPSRAHPADGRG